MNTRDYTKYKMGDFSFIKSDYMREMLIEDYGIINKNNSWATLANASGNVNIELSNGHSGVSYSMSLKAFMHIAKNGWSEYVKAYIESNY